MQNGNRTKAELVAVSFRARSHANVAEVLVYDGEKIIAEHLGMAMKGDNLDASFEIPGSPEVDRGINVVVGVTFDQGRARRPVRCRWKSSASASTLKG